MSGIIGVVQFDGKPLDRGLLQQLTNFLAFRGPDAQRIWTNHNVGFGHTLFKTTDESERGCQPLTLDGKAWIVSDARIDAREDLFTALKTAGEADLERSDCTDAELILRAYRCWGANCVERLLGDFAFGIWDDSRQQLFCARDHMGVKPFYYAQVGSAVVFSNTLDCIRRHPGVSDQLNDLAIADFLLFGLNQDFATTSFSEISRLAPATWAFWSRSGMQSNRYWSMPIDEPLFHKHSDDYADQFRELLRQALGDRLRSKRVSVFLSGGLDSGTLAATARDLLAERYSSFRLDALTYVDSFVPDEGRYATLTANSLRIPIRLNPWTETSDFAWERIQFAVPEPWADAFLIPAERGSWRQIEGDSRVFLYGEGPDNALMLDWRPYLAHLARKGQYGRLLHDVVAAALAERRPPFWGRFSNWANRAKYVANYGQPAYPAWLNPNFESRLRLRERWTAHHSQHPSIHPIRPKAYASLQSPLWQNLFERLDPGVTRTPFEVRQPFVDIRMLRFLLAVPPLPWCRSKYLLRKAMRGVLPEAILRRGKATIDVRLIGSFLSNFCPSPFLPMEEIGRFIDLERFPILPGPDATENILRVRILNHWLQNSARHSHNLQEGNACDRFAQPATSAG